jgi:hypothetical protein
MTNEHFIENYQKLPKTLQAQVANFTEFLLQKYVESNKMYDFTEEEWTKMDIDFDESIDNPSRLFSIEDLKADVYAAANPV